jgi:DnaK suppressor protein
MTPASKGTSVKKAPAARAVAASKSGAGTKSSSSKAGTSVAKRSSAKTEAKKDANRPVSKAAAASKRAVPTTQKGSAAKKAASVTNNAKTASTAKNTASTSAKKASTEKSSGAANAVKKVAASQKTATSTKAGVAPAARTTTAKKAGSRSAKDATTVLTDSAETSTPPVSSGAPAANGAGAGRSTLGPKPKPAPVRPKTGPYAKDAKFLEEMRESLLGERAIYQEQATSLRAEADSLALEREPGDVQFDEESGEGGTVTVDRERNLALSGQAAMAVEEIDAALARIDDKTYGYCERCFQPIPKPRLRALPYARLCVACKSGGLSRR